MISFNSKFFSLITGIIWFIGFFAGIIFATIAGFPFMLYIWVTAFITGVPFAFFASVVSYFEYNIKRNLILDNEKTNSSCQDNIKTYNPLVNMKNELSETKIMTGIEYPNEEVIQVNEITYVDEEHWGCSCGATNRNNRNQCYKCGQKK